VVIRFGFGFLFISSLITATATHAGQLRSYLIHYNQSTKMVSHIDTGSAADKRAAQQGRKYNGRIYGTVAQKQAAQAAGASYNQGGGTKKKTGGGPAPATRGWESHVLVQEWTCVLTDATMFEAIALLGPMAQAGNLTACGGEANVQIQGVRLEVSVPFAATKLRWSAAVVAELSAGAKTPAQVAGVAGAVGSGDVMLADGWFTVGLSDNKRLKKTGLAVQPTLALVVALENKVVASSTERVRIKAHITVLKPSAGGTSAVHAL